MPWIVKKINVNCLFSWGQNVVIKKKNKKIKVKTDKFFLLSIPKIVLWKISNLITIFNFQNCYAEDSSSFLHTCPHLNIHFKYTLLWGRVFKNLTSTHFFCLSDYFIINISIRRGLFACFLFSLLSTFSRIRHRSLTLLQCIMKLLWINKDIQLRHSSEAKATAYWKIILFYQEAAG